MQLVTYSRGKAARLGLVAGSAVIDLHAADAELPAGMRPFLEAGPVAIERAAAVLSEWSAGRLPPAAVCPLEDLALLPPVPEPSKVVAVGQNYRDHCRETGKEPPKIPILFAKLPTSLIGPGQTITWDPALTAEVDYEAELAVVIGRRARNVPAGRAFEFIAGYTCANDVTARNLQRGDGQWVRGKSLDTFCPMGPWLVTRDEIPEPGKLGIACRLNGETVQDSTTAEMIFDIPTLVEFVTRAFTLLPGDVLLTGTPHGTGGYRRPPLFLRDGILVEVEIEKVGLLRNSCREVAAG
ncbi:MAG TPA: fumarylacetoacetate hydrolase family protein [Anaerolineae bacterium]|nr:fumarylacetoacetate hydrolase family protein [Anaerolineae bacterium]